MVCFKYCKHTTCSMRAEIVHAQFVNRKSESTVWCGNQTLDTLGATSQLHHSRLQSYISWFFFKC